MLIIFFTHLLAKSLPEISAKITWDLMGWDSRPFLKKSQMRKAEKMLRSKQKNSLYFLKSSQLRYVENLVWWDSQIFLLWDSHVIIKYINFNIHWFYLRISRLFSGEILWESRDLIYQTKYLNMRKSEIYLSENLINISARSRLDKKKILRIDENWWEIFFITFILKN